MRALYTNRTQKLGKVLDPGFYRSRTADDATLRPIFQSTYPVTADVTEEVTNETLNFLFGVLDYGAEAESVD